MPCSLGDLLDGRLDLGKAQEVGVGILLLVAAAFLELERVEGLIGGLEAFEGLLRRIAPVLVLDIDLANLTFVVTYDGFWSKLDSISSRVTILAVLDRWSTGQTSVGGRRGTAMKFRDASRRKRDGLERVNGPWDSDAS